MRERPNRRPGVMWWLALLAVLALVACQTDNEQVAGVVDDPAISTLNESDRTEVTNSVPGESTGEGEEPPDDTDPTGGDSRSPAAEADVTPSEVFNVEILAQTIAGVDWFLYRYVDDGSDSFWTMSAAVHGQVDFDPESGCVYRALDGDRDPAVWPRGTTISPTGDSLVLRSGEVLEDGAGFEGAGGGLPVPTLIERCPADSGSDGVGIGIINPTGS